MAWLRKLIVLALICLAISLGSKPGFSAQQFNITGGLPTITGSLGGSVTGSPTAPLSVTVNFGELSPTNSSGVVKVVIPVIIRSDDPYQVTVSVTGSTSGDPNAVQLSDIGFGIQNLRPLSGGRNCNRTPHTINAPFNNDPSVTVNRTDRASYPSSLANIGPSTVVLFGPRLSRGGDLSRSNNGWAFDAILVVVPQYFTPGAFTLTLTFNIGATSCACPC
jgi:hypothetical protein